MRRAAGVTGLQRQAKANEQFKEVGSVLASTELVQLKEQFERFRGHLEDFAKKHKKQIQNDPIFRSRFNEMCSKLGINPFNSTKGFWATILGMGDFYYELAVDIVEICMSERSANGGLIPVTSLMKLLQDKRKDVSICESDVLSAVNSLKPLGNGFSVIKIGDTKMIQSIPREISFDLSKLLDLVSGKNANTAYLSGNMIKNSLNWPLDRINVVLDEAITEGIVWIDEQSELNDSQILYWFPSLFFV